MPGVGVNAPTGPFEGSVLYWQVKNPFFKGSTHTRFFEAQQSFPGPQEMPCVMHPGASVGDGVTVDFEGHQGDLEQVVLPATGK